MDFKTLCEKAKEYNLSIAIEHKVSPHNWPNIFAIPQSEALSCKDRWTLKGFCINVLKWIYESDDGDDWIFMGDVNPDGMGSERYRITAPDVDGDCFLMRE